MQNTKKYVAIIAIATIILTLFFTNAPVVLANSNTYVNLSDNEITVNNNTISQNTTEYIYLTNIMNNGGSSDNAKDANIQISNIININNSGTYEFTGKLSDGQISVNANNINGDVTIILNNVDITCKNAPAIFVYSTDTKATNCNVTIKSAEGSANTISGGKIKQSVEGWIDQTEIIYYVEKGYNDEKEYYERYKYDGAISSDISLTFEGEGNLTINSLKKEGIESKRNITINSGNYVINSLDDGINACTDNESVININGGNILVNVLSEADEGDGIDSNGSIYINGGTVYAFASETSQDSGLDSDTGIYINGGIIVGTGNMADAVSNDSEQEFMQLQFRNKVSKDDLITITDKEQNPIIAYKTDREYSVLTISSPNLTDEEHYVYEGGTIQGNNANGLYTEITSYIVGTEKEYNTVSNMGRQNGMQKDIKNIKANDAIYYCIFAILTVLLVVLIVISIVLKKKGKFTLKGQALTLIIGILIGAILTTAGFFAYNKLTFTNPNARVERIQGGGMFEREEMQKPEQEQQIKKHG